MPRKSTTRKKSASSKIKNIKSTAERTIKKAAANVHTNANRAHELAAALIRAGELIEQGAELLDSIAGRATNVKLG